MEDLDFTYFVRRVKEKTKIDLAQYKEAQMKRRLTSLRLKRGYDTFAAYYDAIMKNPVLFDEFLDRMTINVSEFWRNRNRWEVLESEFLPELYKNRAGLRLKCWSAACSTGEEPYTLAMILAEQNMLNHAQIIASDIDEGVLEKAKQGVYPDRAVRDVPAHYMNKYFKEQDGELTISPTLRLAVQFERKNLLVDPFDSHFDLIVCRNVIIYFTEEAKHLLYQKFSKALRPGGILFVGSTEQIFNPGQYEFESADTFFYRKIG